MHIRWILNSVCSIDPSSVPNCALSFPFFVRKIMKQKQKEVDKKCILLIYPYGFNEIANRYDIGPNFPHEKCTAKRGTGRVLTVTELFVVFPEFSLFDYSRNRLAVQPVIRQMFLPRENCEFDVYYFLYSFRLLVPQTFPPIFLFRVGEHETVKCCTFRVRRILPILRRKFNVRIFIREWRKFFDREGKLSKFLKKTVSRHAALLHGEQPRDQVPPSSLFPAQTKSFPSVKYRLVWRKTVLYSFLLIFS